MAVVGRGGWHIARAAALGHFAGYTICNEGSVRGPIRMRVAGTSSPNEKAVQRNPSSAPGVAGARQDAVRAAAAAGAHPVAQRRRAAQH